MSERQETMWLDYYYWNAESKSMPWAGTARWADGSLKLAIKIRSFQKVFFVFFCWHTADNCIFSITSLGHSRGNVSQQYWNWIIMEALIIIKVLEIITKAGLGGGRWGWVEAFCCSCSGQDLSSSGGNSRFNYSWFWISSVERMFIIQLKVNCKCVCVGGC